MKAMTTEQRQIIHELLEKVADRLSRERLMHILNAINPAATSNYPHGEIIIKDLKILVATNNLNKENNMKAIQPKEEVIVIIEDGFDTETNNNNKKEATTMATNSTTCPKCSGTGIYNVPLKDGSIGKCFPCKGTGINQSSTRPMSEAQIKLIRSLFAEAQGFMTKEQQNNLTNKMVAHINGSQKQTSKWASAAIDKLFEIKRANAS